MGLPDGIEKRDVGNGTVLATRGEPVYGEPTANGWREWSVTRSKLAGLIDRGVDVGLSTSSVVLYLGAASGTTVSHVADVAEVVYAVEFAPSPMRDLLDVASSRENVIPLLKDARRPETYAHVVESGVDVVIQDVATRGQAAVALANRDFLDPTGTLVLFSKARSEDVTRRPEAVFDDVLEQLSTGYDVRESVRLEPLHIDHLGIIASPRT